MCAARLSQGAASAGRGDIGPAQPASAGGAPLFGLPDASWVTPADATDSVFECLGPLQGHGGGLLDGSMGKVFRGTWRGKPVAAKIHCAFASADEGPDVYLLRSNRAAVEGVLREVMRELQALATLRHSNIISLFGVAWGTYSGVPVPKYMCMELASASLREAMTGATWGLVDARRRLCEVAHGLKYLHQRSFVHRDIKPANILLLDGIAKVADLGLTKRTTCRSTISPGTLLYLAKIEEVENMLPSRDVFAFGITFVEAVVKRPLDRIRDRDGLVLEATTVFSAGADLLRRCTDLDEQRRPAMTDVREECEHINVIMDEAPTRRLSNFEQLYASVAASAPRSEAEVSAAVRDFLLAYCGRVQPPISQAEVHGFVPSEQVRLQEVVARKDWPMEAKDWAALWWTDERPLAGEHELCSCVNDALIADLESGDPAAWPLVLFVRALNEHLLSRGDGMRRWPRDRTGSPVNVCFRGCGIPRSEWGWFVEGMQYRVPFYVSSAVSEGVPLEFAARSRYDPVIMEIHLIPPIAACCFLDKSVFEGDLECLFVPYSIFRVGKSEVRDSVRLGEHCRLTLLAVPDHADVGTQDLPLAVWH